MPGKKSGRGKRGGGGGAKSAVAALSRSEVWDRSLAIRKDSCHVSDRVSLGSLTGTPSGGNLFVPFVTLAPAAITSGVAGPGVLGTRVYDLARCFTRYRINRLLAVYRPVVGTTTAGIAGVAFLDDPDTAPTEGIPQTVISASELRCSHTDSVYRDIEVEWRPVDGKTWYYTDPAQATPSGADLRFQSPVAIGSGAAFVSGTNVSFGVLYLYYDITFEGAVDPDPQVA